MAVRPEALADEALGGGEVRSQGDVQGLALRYVAEDLAKGWLDAPAVASALLHLH